MHEKLISLLCEFYLTHQGPHDVAQLADFLIANGVAIPVRCKDCVNGSSMYKDIMLKRNVSCNKCGKIWRMNDFCSYGERKTND